MCSIAISHELRALPTATASCQKGLLRLRGSFALHNGVPDNRGTGGEFYLRGTATLIEDEALRTIAVSSASYAPAERYILFELHVTEAHCNGYGDVTLPSPTYWRSVAPDH